MKKLHYISIFLISLIVFSYPQTLLSQEEERLAVVSSFDGQIKIKHGGVWKTVTKIGNRMRNSSVHSGDTVSTMPGTTAVLIFNDNSRLEVKADTTLIISEELITDKAAQDGYVANVAGTLEKEVVRNIKITAGGLWANITPSKSVLTEFETPTGTASVRGTALGIDLLGDGRAAINLGDGEIGFVSPGEVATFNMVAANGVNESVTIGVSLEGVLSLNVNSGDIEAYMSTGQVINLNTGDGVQAIIDVPAGELQVEVTGTGDDGTVGVSTSGGTVELSTEAVVSVGSEGTGDNAVTTIAVENAGDAGLVTLGGMSIGEGSSISLVVDDTGNATVTDVSGDVSTTNVDGSIAPVETGDTFVAPVVDGADFGAEAEGDVSVENIIAVIEDGAAPGAIDDPADVLDDSGTDVQSLGLVGNLLGGDGTVMGLDVPGLVDLMGALNDPNTLGAQNTDTDPDPVNNLPDPPTMPEQTMTDSDAMELLNYYGTGGFSIPENPNSVVIGNDLFTNVDIGPEGRIHSVVSTNNPFFDNKYGLVSSILNGGPNEDDRGVIFDDGFGISFDKEDPVTGVPIDTDLVATYSGVKNENMEMGGSKGTSFYSRNTGGSVTTNTSFDDVLISHEYRLDDSLTGSNNVLVSDITLTNTGAQTVTNLKYRRRVDFDLSTGIIQFDLFSVPSIAPGDILIQGVAAPSAFPKYVVKGDISPLVDVDTTPGFFVGDGAAIVQLNLGNLASGDSITFPVFFGADNPTVDEIDPLNNRTAFQNLQESMFKAGSTTNITLSDDPGSAYALGSGNSLLKAPTQVAAAEKELFKILSDSMSLMMGHLAETSYSSHAMTLARKGDTTFFKNPTSIAVNNDGGVLVGDRGSDMILRLGPSRLNPWASSIATMISSGGRTSRPTGIAVDSDPGSVNYGDVFVTDDGGGGLFRIEKATIGPGWTVTPIAAQFPIGNTLYSPEDVAIDGNGDLIVVGQTFGSKSAVFRVDPSNGNETVIATANDARFESITIGNDGSLFVADRGNEIIYRIDPSTGKKYKLATERSTNGNIQTLENITTDSRGFLYFVDSGRNDAIFKMHPVTGETKFIASKDTTGTIDRPFGIAIDGNGTIFFADHGNGLNSSIVKLPKTTNDKYLLAFAGKLRADVVAYDNKSPDTVNAQFISGLDGLITMIQNNVDSDPSGVDYIPGTVIFNELETARNNFITNAGLGGVFSHLDISHLLLDAVTMSQDSVFLNIDEIDADVNKAREYLVKHITDFGSSTEHDDLVTNLDGIITNTGIVKGDIWDLDTAHKIEHDLETVFSDLVNHISPGNNPFGFLKPFTNTDAINMMADNGVGGAFVPDLAINTQNVIDNDTLTVGISRDGSLIEPDENNSDGGVGLIMNGFTNNGNEGGDVLTFGAPSEGYGVSYDAGGNSFMADIGNVFSAGPSTHGATIYTKHNATRMETFTSEVGVGRADSSLKGDLNITHQFKLIPAPDEAPEGNTREKILAIEVTMTNTGDNDITDLLYRRIADFDNGKPGVHNDVEFVVPDITAPIVSGDATLEIVGAPPDTNFGFDPTTGVSNSLPGTYTGDTIGFTALLQFDLDTLEAGKSKTFEFFYAGDKSEDDLQDTINEAINNARYVSSTSSTVDPYHTFALGAGSEIKSFDTADVPTKEASHFNILTDTLSLMIQDIALISYAAKTVVSQSSLGKSIMDEPVAITIDKNNIDPLKRDDLIVADRSSEKILRLHETSPDVWSTTVITDHPKSDHLIEDPTGIAIASNGDIFLTDDYIDAVLRIRQSEADPAVWETTVVISEYLVNADPAHIDNPTDVTIDDVTGDLIVVDRSSEMVLRLHEESTGDWTTTEITNHSDSGHLVEDPNGVVVAGNGDIILTDIKKDVVLKVNPNSGQTNIIASQFDSPGGDEIIDEPRGITIDNNGLLVVTDDGNTEDTVLKIDPVTGDTKVIASESSTDGKIDRPRGVTVSSDGSIFVADKGSDSIVKLEQTTSTNYLLAFAQKIRGDMVTHDDEHQGDAADQAAHGDFTTTMDGVIDDIEINISNPNTVDKMGIFNALKVARNLLMDHADMREPVQHASLAHILLDSRRQAEDQVRLNLVSIYESINQVKNFMDEHINNFGDTTVHRDINFQVDSILTKIGIVQGNIYDLAAANAIRNEIQETFCDVVDHTVRGHGNPFAFCHHDEGGAPPGGGGPPPGFPGGPGA